jgi:uncharacterized protein (TIGR02996 family)
LLVYVEAERLRELLPDAIPGETWTIKSGVFGQPQLERLDEHSWLFVFSGTDIVTRCLAVLRHPRFENGIFVGGVAEVVNRDVTHVLARLGCNGGPAGAAAWARTPRILPPSDMDLLRYELALSDNDEAVAPVVPDDDRTRELRAAVWDDPLSDDARMVYADYLQDRGDPRGELVALQVTRARTGEHTSDRERQLLRHIAKDLGEPLTPYLVSGFQIARGFVTKCTVNDVPMPDAIRWHAAWRTVEDLSTTNFDLLVSPHVRARRVGMGGRQLVQLVEHPKPPPFETIVGIAPLGKSQRGVWLEEGHWDIVTRVGALTELRTLSVNPEMSGLGPRLIPRILASPLGARLLQLDAFIEPAFADALRWRESFDATRTPLLSLRFVPLEPERGRRMWLGPEVLVALRRTTRAPHLIVQVDDVLSAENVTETMRLVAQLSRNVQFAELHDFGAPATRIQERHNLLLERMNAMFQQVLVQPNSAKPLAP